MQLNRKALGVLALLVFFQQACSHGISKRETDDPSAVIRGACAVESLSREVVGSVWMKAKSKEASGQFPANVQVKFSSSAPLELRLEIKHLFGARAALIEVRGDDFRIETNENGTIARKATSWGGIPLEWASQLFLDRFPCPNENDLKTLKWKWESSDHLVGARATGEVIWRFKFTQWNFKPWVQSIFWQKLSGKTLEIKRDDPEPREGWAQKWEVISPAGQVKVRWKDRKIH